MKGNEKKDQRADVEIHLLEHPREDCDNNN